MGAAKIMKEHAQGALRMAELAPEEDRMCLVALAQVWLKRAAQLEQKKAATPPKPDPRRGRENDAPVGKGEGK